jgi:hypothetical protein
MMQDNETAMTDTSPPADKPEPTRDTATATERPTTPSAQETRAETNAMALASFALSVLGCLLAPAALGGIVCGHLARRQIRQRGDAGDSWALAGLILGYLLIALSLAGLLMFGGMMLTMFGIMAFSS